MSITYLAIDKDVAIHNRERTHWLNRGVSDIRVQSMTEGIEKAMSNQFLYIAINADNINYIPQLKILSKITNDPIVIGTSTFTVQEQIKAMRNGADFFGKFSSTVHNSEAALAVINRVDERAKQRKKTIT